MTMPTVDRAIVRYQDHVGSLNRYYKLARNGYDYYQTGLEMWQKYLGYTVFVDSSDLVYTDLIKWFRKSLPEKKQRTLYASTLDSYDAGWEDGGNNVNLSFAGDFDRTMVVDGHKMRVAITQGSRNGSPRQFVAAGVFFYARSDAGRQAVIAMLGALTNKRSAVPDAEDRDTRDPNLYTINRHGSWDRLHVPWRPIESVVLAEGQAERITSDMQEFIENERFYVRRSLPYHRGYLFHGPPGTGKTSLVRALAKHFGLDLWSIPLGDIKKDSDLVGLVRDIRGRAILLLEDVDVYSTVTRSQKAEKATLSGLLNTIDGVSTPHGLITVLTTNHVKKLDPALLRPGRVDLMEELAAPEGEQLTRLFEYFYEQSPTIDFTGLSYPSSAAVTEVFKQHLRDPRSAEIALAGYPEAAVLEVAA